MWTPAALTYIFLCILDSSLFDMAFMTRAEAHVLNGLESVGLKPSLNDTEIRSEIDAGRSILNGLMH